MTAQEPDLIRFEPEGELHDLCTNPLEDWLHQQGIGARPIEGNRWGFASTANYRGYVATFLIHDGRLWIEDVDPQQVTLVPDDPAQATSDHGWDFAGKGNFLTSVVQRLKRSDRRISLFCDPDAGAAGIAAAKATGADRVELFTGPYGACHDDPEQARQELAVLAETCKAALAAGLGVNAGHDLTLDNLTAFQAAVPGVAEVSIGHGITADALLMGFAEAVAAYRKALADQ